MIIVCIVGPSGSGKTFASFFLQQMYGWNTVISYTTRPMRTDEINGRDHWFVKPEQMPNKSKMCAYTLFNNYHYWTEWNQFSNDTPNVYVIDEKGLIDLKNNIKNKYKIISIYIKRNNMSNIDSDRINRDKERLILNDDIYDFIIDNNDDISHFKLKLTECANNIIS